MRLVTAFFVFSILTLSTTYGQVIINELRLDSGWVELHNTADTAFDVSSWQLCKRPSYAQISGLTVISGSTTIPAKGFVVIAWSQIGGSARELGLYTQGPFNNVNNIRDYIQYGGIASPTRAPTAVAAGVWSGTADVVDLPPLTRHTLECTNFQASTGEDTGLDDWAPGFRSLGSSNHDNVIINELNLDGQWVELKNTGNAPIDVGNWELCDRPSYAKISNLTILSGTNPIPADSFLVIQWGPISNSVGEMALYKQRPFGSVANIRDYTVYGGIPGSNRIGVAVNAGVWDATNVFIPFPVVDSNSLENINTGASSGIETTLSDWVEDIPTLGMENQFSDCPPEYTSANGNLLTGSENGIVEYATDGAIESEQLILATAAVIYDGGIAIDLLPDFEVELGGEFTAVIDGCD